ADTFARVSAWGKPLAFLWVPLGAGQGGETGPGPSRIVECRTRASAATGNRSLLRVLALHQGVQILDAKANGALPRGAVGAEPAVLDRAAQRHRRQASEGRSAPVIEVSGQGLFAHDSASYLK